MASSLPKEDNHSSDDTIEKSNSGLWVASVVSNSSRTNGDRDEFRTDSHQITRSAVVFNDPKKARTDDTTSGSNPIMALRCYLAQDFGVVFKAK